MDLFNMNYVYIMMNSQRCWLLPSATKLGEGYIFTGVCHSVNRGVCGRGVGGCLLGGCLLQGVSAPRGVSAPGGWWGCLFRGVCSQGGGCLVWGEGVCLLWGGLVDTPPTRPLLRAVRILLEFILVQMCCSAVKYCKTADLIIYE